MLEVYKHKENAILPTRAFKSDAGLDLYLLEDTFLPVMSTKILSTGISIRIPDGKVGKIEDRSSLSIQGLRTGGGIIDPGYTGEIKIVMHNLSNQGFYNSGEYGIWLKSGDKIAQLLVYSVDIEEVEETRWMWNSLRSDSGFGSSGA